MALKPIYPADLPAIDTMGDGDSLLGLSTVNGLKRWSKIARIAWSKISGAPTALKNPQAITFTGGVTGAYDGSAAKSVKIPGAPSDVGAAAASHKHTTADVTGLPARLPNPQKLRIIYDSGTPDESTLPPNGSTEYDGVDERNIRVFLPQSNRNPLVIKGASGDVVYDGGKYVEYTPPTKQPNPQPLIFIGGAAPGSYDGSADKTVKIPDTPGEVQAAKAVHTHVRAAITDFAALTFTGGVTGKYDGSSPLNVYIPVRTPAPTGMSLDYPATVSVRNAILQRIDVLLLPAFVMQDCVLFLPAGGDAIELYPDGTFRVMRLGKSKIYVIPTQNSRAYKSVEITVRPAIARRTGSGAFRKTGAGKLRLF